MKNILTLAITLFFGSRAVAKIEAPVVDTVKQCTVRAYSHKKPVGDYFNYAEGTKDEICADAINQCLVDGFLLQNCHIVFFGHPFGDE